MNHADGSISFVHRTEEGKRDGVVTAEGDDTRQGLLLERRAWSRGVGHGGPHKELVVTVLDLLNSIGIVVPDLFFKSVQV